VIQCKRLHLAEIKVFPLAVLTVLALILLVGLWFGNAYLKPTPIAAPVNVTASQPDRYLGTWEVTDPGTRRRQGISFLLIAQDGGANDDYLVESANKREVFRYRDGRLINDTVTILYDNSRDTIRHSNLGELERKPKSP
jgi:hypothetical protein